MTHLLKYLLGKHYDLSLISRAHAIKKKCSVAHILFSHWGIRGSQYLGIHWPEDNPLEMSSPCPETT